MESLLLTLEMLLLTNSHVLRTDSSVLRTDSFVLRMPENHRLPYADHLRRAVNILRTDSTHLRGRPEAGFFPSETAFLKTITAAAASVKPFLSRDVKNPKFKINHLFTAAKKLAAIREYCFVDGALEPMADSIQDLIIRDMAELADG